MSAKFCLLIPSKILRIDKHFGQKLAVWLAEAEAADRANGGLSNYSLDSLSEFQKRPDVNLNLPDNFGGRYHVIDWGFYFMPDALLMDFLSWLADIYVYGEVGILIYWSYELRRFPPVKISDKLSHRNDLSVNYLPLDELLFFSLSNWLHPGGLPAKDFKASLSDLASLKPNDTRNSVPSPRQVPAAAENSTQRD